MSLCRWSSDNFNCDLYIYESVYGGYQINLATSKYKGEIPEVDYSLLTKGCADWDKFNEQREIQSDYLAKFGTEPLKLKEVCQDKSVDTLEELLEEVLHLRECGYRFPDSLIEKIEGKIKCLK